MVARENIKNKRTSEVFKKTAMEMSSKRLPRMTVSGGNSFVSSLEKCRSEILTRWIIRVDIRCNENMLVNDKEEIEEKRNISGLTDKSKALCRVDTQIL